jgi:hypothetical protein
VIPRTRRLAAPVAVALAAIAATAYLGVVDPNEPGHYPLCPTKALTGLDCPGCGGLRAVHSLVHLDLVGALDHNAFVVLLVLPIAFALWAAWLVRAWRDPDRPDPDDRQPSRWTGASLQGPLAVWSFVAVMVAFVVVRNVASFPALHWLGSASG